MYHITATFSVVRVVLGRCNIFYSWVAASIYIISSFKICTMSSMSSGSMIDDGCLIDRLFANRTSVVRYMTEFQKTANEISVSSL